MNKQLTVVLSIAILLTVTVVASSDLSQTADAVKSKGNSLTEVGSSKVCGDRLCSEIPSDERKPMKSDSISVTTSADVEALMDRMDSVHKKHQSQMMQMWKSMSAHEQSQMVQKMS